VLELIRQALNNRRLVAIQKAPQQNLWVPHAGSGRCPIS
jgi:hypothetical protein